MIPFTDAVGHRGASATGMGDRSPCMSCCHLAAPTAARKRQAPQETKGHMQNLTFLKSFENAHIKLW